MEIFVFEFVEDFFEEGEDEHFFGGLGIDAAGLEVELLLGLNARTGGPVAATDVVGLDFQAGEAVGLGLVGEHQVTVLLIGVGLLSVGFDDDQAGENRLCRVEERVFVEEVRRGVGRDMRLERALVELLGAVGDGQGEHLGVSAGAEEAAVRFVAGLASAEVDIERKDLRIALGDDGIGLERQGVAGPVLGAD
ncbi:MAG: hypothetical protein K0R17_3475, partial [Rariglobus sp.]|nr:hypothetical protein [Rariglobus sp.]